MKSFNEWMNEPHLPDLDKDLKRFEAFKPDIVPHPHVFAEHVWDECSRVYVFRLDRFLNNVALLNNDFRITRLVKEFKEEMVKTMIANSVGFVDESKPKPILDILTSKDF